MDRAGAYPRRSFVGGPFAAALEKTLLWPLIPLPCNRPAVVSFPAAGWGFFRDMPLLGAGNHAGLNHPHHLANAGYAPPSL